MSEEVLVAVRQALSKPRLDRYLAATGGDLTQSLKLYGDNMRLSAAVMNVTHIFEVVLRNRIDMALRKGLSDSWLVLFWTSALDFLKDGDPEARHDITFVNCPTISFGPRDYIISEALRAGRQVQKSGAKTVDQNGLVASAMLGYWINLLSPRYELCFWKPYLAEAFSGFKRHQIARYAEDVALIRNRIAHYEPLIFSGQRIATWPEISDAIYAIRQTIRRIDATAFDALERLLDVSSLIHELSIPLGIDTADIRTGSLQRFSLAFPYVFIDCDDYERPVYCDRAKVPHAMWGQLDPGRRVQFIAARRQDGTPFVDKFLNVLPRPAEQSQPLEKSNGAQVVSEIAVSLLTES